MQKTLKYENVFTVTIMHSQFSVRLKPENLRKVKRKSNGEKIFCKQEIIFLKFYAILKLFRYGNNSLLCFLKEKWVLRKQNICKSIYNCTEKKKNLRERRLFFTIKKLLIYRNVITVNFIQLHKRKNEMLINMRK